MIDVISVPHVKPSSQSQIINRFRKIAIGPEEKIDPEKLKKIIEEDRKRLRNLLTRKP